MSRYETLDGQIIFRAKLNTENSSLVDLDTEDGVITLDPSSSKIIGGMASIYVEDALYYSDTILKFDEWADLNR